MRFNAPTTCPNYTPNFFGNFWLYYWINYIFYKKWECRIIALKYARVKVIFKILILINRLLSFNLL